MKQRVQKLGAFLAAMMTPNIGAFIAWGLLTALFIPSGWLPNQHLARMVEPTVLHLLPILIGFSGGRLVYGIRGGVIGAVTTMGVVTGSSVPMFIGAMVAGPFAAWALQRWDRLLAGRVPLGFEMLAANFSGGILGLALMVAAYAVVGPFVAGVTRALGAGASWVTQAGLLPLAALFIEPGKILFMNNAINHGLLSPLGIAEAKQAGKSVFFLLETNPGPGLGLLAAFWLTGKGPAKQSAPGAAIIHFLGGIHEIYFPFALMAPFTIVALIAGGLAADLFFVASHAGLVAVPSPGSILAELAMTPRGGHAPVLIGIAVGAVTSCLVAIPIVRRANLPEATPVDGVRESAPASVAASGMAVSASTASSTNPARPARMPGSIVFACEAGMGSSVIGRSVLQMKLEKAGLRVPVLHAALNEIPDDAEIVISHRSLASRVRQIKPDCLVYGVDDFLHSPVYDELVEQLRNQPGQSGIEGGGGHSS